MKSYQVSFLEYLIKGFQQTDNTGLFLFSTKAIFYYFVFYIWSWCCHGLLDSAHKDDLCSNSYILNAIEWPINDYFQFLSGHFNKSGHLSVWTFFNLFQTNSSELNCSQSLKYLITISWVIVDNLYYSIILNLEVPRDVAKCHRLLNDTAWSMQT